MLGEGKSLCDVSVSGLGRQALRVNITRTILGAASDTERDRIVGYIRGESAYNPDNWKLGDIFRSNPVTIGTPSSYYTDMRDSNNAFATFRTNHPRTSDNEQRIVLLGANDGQLHAFKTADGAEAWSFIPGNFLPKLKNIAHSSHPTGLSHQYFVDGPVTAADIWEGSGSGTSKNATEWQTLLVFAEGRGAGANLWSSSAACDSGFNALYTSTFSNYCGYWAFNITNTLSPVYAWRINPTSAQAPYLGEPWSKMAIGRVQINGNEKWVGFIGGGFNAANCAGGGACDARGKGFYVVDLSNGSILWSYNRANDSTMNYSLPATPAVVDEDNDGFIDTAYIGDLGGNMWRFTFCAHMDGSSCNTANWNGGFLYQSSTGTIRPIYSMTSVAEDANGILWVYWGTGDKTDPTAVNANVQEKFYAVKDQRGASLTVSNLVDVTSGTYSDSSSHHGWYITLPGSGEKVLAEPTVFGGVTYFTSYTPAQGNNPCNQAGTSTLYGVNYITSAGILPSQTPSPPPPQPPNPPVRSMEIGLGIPTAPVVSFKPLGAMPPDIYVTVSGGRGTDVSTERVNFNPPTVNKRTNILSWKDRRVR